MCKDHVGNVYNTAKERAETYNLSYDVVQHRLKAGWSLKDALTVKTNNSRHKGASCTDHLGNVYPSQQDMCSAYNVVQSTFCGRIRKGWSLEAALTTTDMVEDHLGNTYSSLKDMCAAYHVQPSTYRRRMERGMSKEEALTYDGKCINPCNDHLGNRFLSIHDMCMHYGITDVMYFQRKAKGWTLKKILEAPRRHVIYDHLGNSYDSKVAMCKAYNIRIGTFNRRMASGMTLEDALIKDIRRGNFKCKGTITDHKGNVFPSKQQMCREYGISVSTYDTRIRRGKTVEEALAPPSRSAYARPNINHRRSSYKSSQKSSVECQDHLGNYYNSESAMCKEWKIPYNTYRSRKRSGMSLKDNLTTPVKKKEKQIEYHGNSYSITALAKELDISTSCLSKGLRQNKGIDDIVTTYRSRMNPTHYDPINKEYASLKQISKNHGIKYTTLLRRLDHGDSMEQALTKKILPRKREFRDHKGNIYQSLQEMCAIYDVPVTTYKSRIKAGTSVEEALTTLVDRTRCATFKATYLFQIDNVNYYGAICNICHEEHVMTRDEMFAHQKKYHEKG